MHVPSFIRNDFPRKLTAFGFAVIIWLAAGMQLREYTVFRDVPVTLVYDARRLDISQRAPTVTVMLKGNPRRLATVRTNDIQITAHVPEVAAGVQQCEIRLTDENVKTPLGTRFNRVVPATFSVDVDVIATKVLPVKVDEIGELTPGYRIVKRVIQPETVRVEGPSRVLEQQTFVPAEPVPLDDTVVERFDMMRRITTPAALRCEPDSVRVSFDVVKYTGVRNYNDLPVHILGGADGAVTVASVLPRVSVLLSGPATSLEALRAADIRPFVDLTGVPGPGRHPCRVQVWLDPAARLSVEKVLPDTIEIEVVEARRRDTTGAPPAPPPAP